MDTPQTAPIRTPDRIRSVARRRWFLPGLIAVVILAAGLTFGIRAIIRHGYPQLTMTVTGTGAADITWTSNEGGEQLHSQTLPWTHTMRVPAGKPDPVILTVQGDGVQGCTVTLADRTVAAEQSDGAGGANCIVTTGQ